MFTGIISSKAIIKQTPPAGQAGKVVIEVTEEFLRDTKLGDSIAVDGVCLTVIDLNENNFVVEISSETVAKTTFGHKKANQKVNLEHAIKFGDSLDGHLVQGHVDTVIKAININVVDHNKKVVFEVLNQDYLKYIAAKGSVTINGVSLTVNQVCKNNFSVNLIPYTLSATTMSDLRIGDLVNLEVDIFARYCVNYLDRINTTFEV